MILKLEQVPKRTLEIEKPDGTIISLVVKRIPVRDIPALEDANKDISKKYAAGKLNTVQYYYEMIKLVVEDFNPEDIEDLDYQHLATISEHLKQLQQNKPEAEKKSPGR